MRLLVLGGTGWLGGEIVRAALARGYEVVCLARGTSDVPAGATLVRADRDDPEAYSALDGHEASAGFDAAIDLTRDPEHARGAVGALRDRVPHWVFVSTCSVYADDATPGQDESGPLLPALTGAYTMERYGEAKVACEEAVLSSYGIEHAMIARSGLITGPGDHSDRTGYWPLRFAHPASDDGAVLVPDAPDAAVQLIDARDLAAWLVDGAAHRTAGVFNAMAQHVPLPEYLDTARQVAGHAGAVVPVDQAWIAAHDIAPWSGPRSFPIWLPQPEYAGFATRRVDAALGAGLRPRPLADSIHDTLAWCRPVRAAGGGPGSPPPTSASCWPAASRRRRTRGRCNRTRTRRRCTRTRLHGTMSRCNRTTTRRNRTRSRRTARRPGGTARGADAPREDPAARITRATTPTPGAGRRSGRRRR
ncbi:NAD-dependent epimerase/dehydratase family protein [Flexivirga sp. ID2601S]|uniref:NAD-dependent epimerase/dehydratase family protein n=1 Tax=Flexivirga aerilata TaxID=1656889 RepID=A0A849AKQ7_9MICO|nr:NAD-dependent epimerase/dehydratase family protein [Flexivirga aerilata]NNG40995.1 NAD-dependent epimerase/dehydratase family protein [Flexivirga aerilata]